MKHVLASLAIGACLLLPSAGVVLGAGPPTKPAQNPATGQPGTSAGFNCGGAGMPGLLTPGQAASAPGAPFNEPAPVGIGSGGVAGQHYAGNDNTASLANANSMAAVSQYDVACVQATAHQPP
jgi:hypothetical protein